MPRKYELIINDTIVNVEVDIVNEGILSITIGEMTFPVRVSEQDRNSGTFKVTVGDTKHTIHINPNTKSHEYNLTIKKQTYSAHLKPITPTPTRPFAATLTQPTVTRLPSKIPEPTSIIQHATEPGTVVAPLPGRILEVQVKEGEKVKSGDVLLVLEAMKMANEIRSPQEGKVEKVHIQGGDTVEKGQPMITLK